MSDFNKDDLPRETHPVGSDSHQEFRELCALSTTGELTDQEQKRLGEHLAGCSSCAKLLIEYEELATTVMPALAPEVRVEIDKDEASENPDKVWSLDRAEERLITSLGDKPGETQSEPSPPKRSVGGVALKFAVAASLFGASSLGFYHLGQIRNRHLNQTMVPAPPSPVSVVSQPDPSPQSATSESAAQSPAVSEEKRITALGEAIAREEREKEDLKVQLNQLRQELTRTNSELAQTQSDQSELVKELDKSKAKTQSLEAKASQSADQTEQGSEGVPILRAKIGDLNTALEAKEKEIAQDEDLLAHDRDIRNLIGARNLYIAEIYDVDKAGDTQKPFGRIFYTKDRSLIFYGYDLDQQHGIKKDASFQAWGRRGKDRGPDVNLGLLYVDDADKRRWALKFNDPKTIAQLDAVFITVEPQGGSAKPTSKPLLFTYLRLDPNHP